LLPAALRAVVGPVCVRCAGQRGRIARHRRRRLPPARYLTVEKRNTMAFPSDLEIARGAALKPLEPHGEEVMKIKLEAIAELAGQPAARYVVVSAITPTPLGEGKTTTTVGLGQGFKHIGKRATVAIRQPSMGPTFGIKGGAAGGGYSQVVPMEAL